VGSRIAIVVDGRIVSAPTVQVPISSGEVVVASGLTERAAASLASRLDPG
jgi:preprotein translocase subunit SecD